MEQPINSPDRRVLLCGLPPQMEQRFLRIFSEAGWRVQSLGAPERLSELMRRSQDGTPPMPTILFGRWRDSRFASLLRSAEVVGPPKLGVVVLLPKDADPSEARRALALGADELVREPARSAQLLLAADYSLARVSHCDSTCRSEQRYRLLFEAMGSGAIVLDDQERIVDINPEAMRLLRECLTGTLWQGRPVRQAFPCIEPLVCVQVPRSHRQVEILLPHKGKRIFQHTCATSSDRRYRVLLFRDVTEQVDDESRMLRGERLAQVGEMAARLSHEFKNPLASIMAALEVLRGENRPCSANRELLEDVLLEVQRLTQTVRELLDTARAGELSPTELDPAAVVQQVFRSAEGYASQSGTELSVEAEQNLPAFYADEIWFHRALGNLVANGIEAAGQGGHVRLSARVLTPDEVRESFPDYARQVLCFVVQDDGPGIPEEHRQRIFDPFFTTKAKGTGIGLATVMNVVDILGGALVVDSAPGKGASFRVYLPVAHLEACWEDPPPDARCDECDLDQVAGQLCWVRHASAGGRIRPTCQHCHVYLRNSLQRYLRRV